MSWARSRPWDEANRPVASSGEPPCGRTHQDDAPSRTIVHTMDLPRDHEHEPPPSSEDMPEPTEKELRRYTQIGIAAMVAGALIGIGGSLVAHFTGLPETDSLGRDLYPAIPRGWFAVLVGQLISLGGVFLFLAGTTLAFLYKRQMTWARASIGATVFVSLMLILFGIIPNEWLTLTQATFEWTPQKIAVTIPPALALGNEVSISLAAVKDIVSGTYAVVALGAVAVGMYQWQERQKKAASAPPPKPVSPYGRPVTKVKR